MATSEQREHERIIIDMPTRMWLDEQRKGKAIAFEGFAVTRNLAIGGTFLACNYLLPVGFPVNLQMRIGEEEHLDARGEVAHTVSEGEGEEPGMGILFTEVDAENRERLLRFFISERVEKFYTDRFLVEFPHLEETLSLKDVALVVNLWEDREGRLTALHGKPGKAGPARRAPSKTTTAQKTVELR
ncbi:MAG: PilZ domain-containing protein [Myxococcota bacterium]